MSKLYCNVSHIRRAPGSGSCDPGAVGEGRRGEEHNGHSKLALSLTQAGKTVSSESCVITLYEVHDLVIGMLVPNTNQGSPFTDLLLNPIKFCLLPVSMTCDVLVLCTSVSSTISSL